MQAILIWLAVASAIAAVLTVYDKIAAKQGRWRIPEKTLLLWGAVGGAPGELLTMLLIRHKTRHKKFMLGLPLLLALQAAAVALFWWLRQG